MARQEAARFMEKVATDKEFTEKLMGIKTTSEDEPAVEYYARAAKELGFDFTPEEFEEEYQAQKAAREEAADGVELDAAELEQVVGGGATHYEPCRDTFNYGEWCWYSDWCTSAIIKYKLKAECINSYDWMRYCHWTDYCNNGSWRTYD